MVPWKGRRPCAGNDLAVHYSVGILPARPRPEQGFRACLGLIRLGKKYGLERMEAAWRRAVRLRAHSHQNVKSILAPGMDRQPLPQLAAPRPPLEHENIRGADHERFALLVDHHWNGRENQAMLRRLILFSGPTEIGKWWLAQGEQLQRRWLEELRRRPTSPWRESPSWGCAFSIRRDPGAARATSGGRSRRTWQAETNETATHEDRRGGSPPKRKILVSKFSPTNSRRSSQRNCGLYQDSAH